MTHNFREQFQQMRIIHYSLLGGVLLFAAVMYFGGLANSNANDQLYNIFRFLVPGLAAMAIIMGRFISKPIFDKAKESDDLGNKVAAFRAGMILRWALIEGASLFALVAYMLSGNLVMLLVGLAGAGYLFTLRPTAEAAASALGLSEPEYRELGNG